MSDQQQRRVRFQIVLEQTFPADWDLHAIWFYLNESSSCVSNVLDDLARVAEEDGCLCNRGRFLVDDGHGGWYTEDD